MKASSLIVTLVVIATVSTIAFVGISENTEAFSSEESETIQITAQDTLGITDSVTVTVNPDTIDSLN